jgi:glycosyltransferase involved in cell wall biosynthesis
MNDSIKLYKVLHIIDTTGHGGAETVLKTIVCGLNPHRFKSYVLLNDHGWLFEQLSERPDIGVFVFNGKGKVNFQLLRRIRMIIRKYQIDIIHTHLFGSSLYGNLSAYFLKVPVISTFHGLPDWRSEDTFNKIKLGLIYSNAKVVVFVSKYLKKYFAEIAYIRPKKSVCIYNGIPLPKNHGDKANTAKIKLGFSQNDKLIASVGNIKAIKGYDILLKAAKIVIVEYPNVKFVVAGSVADANYQYLLKLKAELRLENNFFFLGYQRNTELVYKASDLFVLPSLSEGFSLSVIEAMAHKLPIVATKSGGPEEILDKDVTGKLVAPNSPLELGEAIIEVIGNYYYQAIMPENAYKYFLDNFSETKMIKQYQSLYASLANFW